jgi:hypothetical protein
MVRESKGTEAASLGAERRWPKVVGNGGSAAGLRRSQRKGMTGGGQLSAGHGEGQKRPEAGVLSCDGDGNQARHHWLMGL